MRATALTVTLLSLSIKNLFWNVFVHIDADPSIFDIRQYILMFSPHILRDEEIHPPSATIPYVSTLFNLICRVNVARSSAPYSSDYTVTSWTHSSIFSTGLGARTAALRLLMNHRSCLLINQLGRKPLPLGLQKVETFPVHFRNFPYILETYRDLGNFLEIYWTFSTPLQPYLPYTIQ